MLNASDTLSRKLAPLFPSISSLLPTSPLSFQDLPRSSSPDLYSPPLQRRGPPHLSRFWRWRAERPSSFYGGQKERSFLSSSAFLLPSISIAQRMPLNAPTNVAATLDRLQGHSEMDRACCSLCHSCVCIPAFSINIFLLLRRSHSLTSSMYDLFHYDPVFYPKLRHLWPLQLSSLQVWAKNGTTGLVNFAPAVTYHFCLNLTIKFLQPERLLV